MIKFEKVELVDKQKTTFQVDHSTDRKIIFISIENSHLFEVPVKEWDNFIEKLNKAKNLITKNESQNQ